MQHYVITIARGYGSGGKTIGKMLAQELGISCYDREILRLASDDSGIDEALFAKADEKLKNTLLFKIARNIYKGELIPPDSDEFVSNDNLFNYQAKVLKELAEKESYVAIGRCADFVLKDHPILVRVFIHAPMDFCMEAVRQRSSLTDREIEKFILATDKHKAEYYKYYTGKVWNDAMNYDLCLDSSVLSWENCVKMIKDYLGLRLQETKG